MTSGEIISPTSNDNDRRYDKGERRYKHVGKTDTFEFKRSKKKPNEWIGLCPKGIPDTDRDRILNAGIADANGDLKMPAPKRLYAVYKGAIYRAETTDYGETYHAYPFRGKLSDSLLNQLHEMARKENCETGFLSFTKTYIERHGK